MQTRTRHLLLEYHGCDPAVLDDERAIEAMLQAASDAAKTQVIRITVHRFSPHGVSGVAVVAASHISVHTWPEAGYAAADVFSCSEEDPIPAHAVLRDGLRAQRAELMVVDRGLAGGARSMQVAAHVREE